MNEKNSELIHQIDQQIETTKQKLYDYAQQGYINQQKIDFLYQARIYNTLKQLKRELEKEQ